MLKPIVWWAWRWVLAAALVVLGAAGTAAQTQSEVSCPLIASSSSAQIERSSYHRSSYHHLSPGGRALVAPLPADDYNSWPQSERTTFEAIVHALEHLKITHLIECVDAVWGVSRSTDGRDQYRLSVTLTSNAVDEIRNNNNFSVWPFGGHVKLPTGHVVGRSFLRSALQTKTARQKRSRGQASVQISWLTSDERTADIDIDYLDIHASNHNKPLNSDVRFGSHHEIHELTFGQSPQLIDWWR